MTRTIYIFRAFIFPSMHVCLSTLAQICCKIRLVSFWVNLNDRHSCVIVYNLYWTSVFKDATNKNSHDCIVVFRNFHRPDFIGTVKESWWYMLSPVLPSSWIWHCAYPIWSSPGFSMNFRMKYFITLQLYFSTNTWYIQQEIYFQFYPFLGWDIFTFLWCHKNSIVCTT